MAVAEMRKLNLVAMSYDKDRILNALQRTGAAEIKSAEEKENTLPASDIAVKSGNVYLGFADRFTGTLIITGEISDVMSAMTEIVDYFRDTLEYVVCKITKR